MPWPRFGLRGGLRDRLPVPGEPLPPRLGHRHRLGRRLVLEMEPHGHLHQQPHAALGPHEAAFARFFVATRHGLPDVSHRPETERFPGRGLVHGGLRSRLASVRTRTSYGSHDVPLRPSTLPHVLRLSRIHTLRHAQRAGQARLDRKGGGSLGRGHSDQRRRRLPRGAAIPWGRRAVEQQVRVNAIDLCLGFSCPVAEQRTVRISDLHAKRLCPESALRPIPPPDRHRTAAVGPLEGGDRVRLSTRLVLPAVGGSGGRGGGHDETTWGVGRTGGARLGRSTNACRCGRRRGAQAGRAWSPPAHRSSGTALRFPG